MESTIVRTLETTAMLVGPNSEVAEKVSDGFAHVKVRVVRVGHAAAACERLAVAMPQVVVVLGSLRADERDALLDRVTAVGALLMYVDPELDGETLDEIIGRAASAAVERKLIRDESDAVALASDPPAPGDEVDVDAGW